MFVENFLSLKPAEFYLRGINNLSDKWQEMIQFKIIVDILLIEINFRLFTNEQYFIKMEIIYDSIQ